MDDVIFPMIGPMVARRYRCSQYLFPPPKKMTYNFPPNAAKLYALNLFLGRDNELEIYHGNFLLMYNKHRKLFVIKQ